MVINTIRYNIRPEASLDRTRARARGGSHWGSLKGRLLRRRRREAIVVGQAGRLIEAEDILVPIIMNEEPYRLFLVRVLIKAKFSRLETR